MGYVYLAAVLLAEAIIWLEKTPEVEKNLEILIFVDILWGYLPNRPYGYVCGVLA